MEIISGLPGDATISLYRCGPMVDLCRGPHLPHAGLLKATAVQAMSRSFWKGDVTREGLQVCTVFLIPHNQKSLFPGAKLGSAVVMDTVLPAAQTADNARQCLHGIQVQDCNSRVGPCAPD